MEDFKLSDQVRHKSGGPAEMTIFMIEGDEADCRWPDGNDFKTGKFRLSELVKIPPK